MTHESPVALLRDRSVALFLASTFLSTMAVASQATVLGKLVFDISHRELDLGLLGLVEFLPAMLLVVWAGSLADRHDRRRIVSLSLAFEAAVSLALAFLVRSSGLTVTPILGLAALYGIGRAFGAPAVRALPANVVERGDLPRLIPLFSLAWQAALISGPVLGGFLYTAGPSWPFVAAVGLSLLGAAAMTAVGFTEDAAEDTRARSAHPERHGVREAAQGLLVIRRTPLLLGAISLDLFAVLFGGAVALLPAIAEDRLGVDATGLGWLRAAGGVGAALTAGVLAVRPLRRHVGPTLFAAVAVFGLATIGLGLTRSFPVALVAMFVLSASDAVSVFIRATLTPLIVPDALRGRVLAVENVFIGASNELGAFESGVVGQAVGASAAIVAGGAATIVVVGIWMVVFPSLRHVDRFDRLEPVEVTGTGGDPGEATDVTPPVLPGENSPP